MIMLKDSVAGEIVQFLGHCEGQSVQVAFIPVLIACHPTINALSINPYTRMTTIDVMTPCFGPFTEFENLHSTHIHQAKFRQCKCLYHHNLVQTL